MQRRFERAWVRWYVEATPGIFLTITILGGFVFGGLTLAFSALAYVGLGQVLGGQPLIPLETTCVPPSIVLVAWLVYRIRWYRIFFRIPGGVYSKTKTE
jgi:hypothetical protein